MSPAAGLAFQTGYNKLKFRLFGKIIHNLLRGMSDVRPGFLPDLADARLQFRGIQAFTDQFPDVFCVVLRQLGAELLHGLIVPDRIIQPGSIVWFRIKRRIRDDDGSLKNKREVKDHAREIGNQQIRPLQGIIVISIPVPFQAAAVLILRLQVV